MKYKFSKTATSDENTLKTAQLKKLSEWILTTAKNIKKEVPELKSRVGRGKFGGGHGYSFSGLLNLDGFSRNDLNTLKPALCELHAVCKEANIAVDLSGFDLLPRVASVSQGGYGSDKEAFLISVDARHEYNYLFNPFSDQELAEEKLPKPLSSDGFACRLR
jgi:hypothetical protein